MEHADPSNTDDHPANEIRYGIPGKALLERDVYPDPRIASESVMGDGRIKTVYSGGLHVLETNESDRMAVVNLRGMEHHELFPDSPEPVLEKRARLAERNREAGRFWEERRDRFQDS